MYNIKVSFVMRKREPLYCIASGESDNSLKFAVQLCNNKTFKVRLSDCIDPGDVYATDDITYLKHCWSKHIANVLRLTYLSVECLRAMSEQLMLSLYPLSITLFIALNDGIHETQMNSRKQIKKLVEEE